MGLYVTEKDIEVRLVGKVRFTDEEDDENRMSRALLRRLINEAEGQVEQDLSPRYIAPFQTIEGKQFKNLPERPTREILRTLCELKAVIRVLETDFGSGTVVDAEKYSKNIEKRYEKIITDRVLAKKEEHSNQWAYPPLPGLQLNYFNTEADDGYAGQVLSTSQGDGDFPSKQIQDPGESWWSGVLDP